MSDPHSSPTSPKPSEHTSEPESTSGDADPDSPAPHPEDSGDLTISFHLDTHDTEPPASGWLVSFLERAAGLCGVTSGSLSVTLIDDPEMARLHGEYCDDPTTTDVLTFDLNVPDQAEGHIEGDLVVCREEAERQAATRGHDARTELLLYAIHGLLHLLGEDDRDPESFERMHRREDELFSALGFPPVFKSNVAALDTNPGDAS